jgi:hypothetical protein
MTGLLRRIRGALVIGAAWALPWAATFTALRVVYLFVRPFPSSLLRQLGMTATVGAVVGFITGFAFSMILSIAERRGTIATLKTGRFALWGAAGGMAADTLVRIALTVVGIVGADALAQLAGPNFPSVWDRFWTFSAVSSSLVQAGVMGAVSAALTLRLARTADVLESERVHVADPLALHGPDLLDDLQQQGQMRAKARDRSHL